MAMDDAMIERLNGIRRSYQALTERLGDPDVISDSQVNSKKEQFDTMSIIFRVN